MVEPESLTLPQFDSALVWLRSLDDPIVEFMVARDIDSRPEQQLGPLRDEVLATEPIAAAYRRQNDDGSWGEDPGKQKRILSTLKMAQVLSEVGADRHPSWVAAIGYLEDSAHDDGGVFSIDGSSDSVLSCYVGIAAYTYLQGGRADLAEPQVRWIERHQEVKVSGNDLRDQPAVLWSDYLRTRYGGCMSSTTCLVGLVKTGRALQRWQDEGGSVEVEGLVSSIREAFLRRHLIYSSDGSVISLGVSPKSPERWLVPTFPLDWRTDLIEVLDFVARSGPADPRIQAALDELHNHQLPDGAWPLANTYKPDHLAALERRNRRRGSPIATLRAVAAIRHPT